FAMEAMKLFSSIKLEGRARECRGLLKNIENESGDSRYKRVVFDSRWLCGGRLVARSDHMRNIVNKIRDLALEDVEVFLEGETGTGKEVAAQLLHSWSGRAERPFVAVNCASVADELFETEFFGHVRGAYSGAVRKREGYLESARGGTLFLDEVSELKRDQQAKLLRVLQEGKLRRVGETEEIDIDIRLILASNERIGDLLESGRLREDFYYRVCSEVIELKPLRERVEDIPELFAYYLNGLSGELMAEGDLFASLKEYSWPGNVRELIKVTRSLSKKAGENGILRVDDLPARIRNGRTAGPSGGCSSNEAGVTPEDKKALIKDTLRKCEGNKAAAARELGVSRSTLYRWLEELKS
ncbi:MAG: AAA domain-containing protein, partial [Candidatus Latescibacteria bacterium]|nr:AAA domain-containing protein [Candidatus Latescibacterota bacterium]